jgi:hypothetical protein
MVLYYYTVFILIGKEKFFGGSGVPAFVFFTFGFQFTYSSLYLGVRQSYSGNGLKY